MHYTAMLCYARPGRRGKRAAREEKLFRRFKADEVVAGDHRATAAWPARKTTTSGRRFTITKRWHCWPVAAATEARGRDPSGAHGKAAVLFDRVRGDASWRRVSRCCVAGQVVGSGSRERSWRCDVHRRHRGRGHQVHAQQRPGGQEVAARDDGRGRGVLRCRRRRLARHAARQQQRLDSRAGGESLRALYRNNRNGTFTDVTAGSGLDVEMYGMGVAVGDYDNDGRDDVYITALEGDRLFHNEGGGKFRDVTKAAGIDNANFGTSAAWLDYDKDGKPRSLRRQLRAVDAARRDLWCSLDGATKSYCTPESYKGTSSKLYHNLGGGQFEDASTSKAGIADPTSKSLGVAVLDYDGDGWPDLFVANDTQPNKLYRNNGNGTFTEDGLSRRRGLQRRRRRARRDGRRRGRLRPIGPPAPAGRQLLEPDARPLSQRGQRVCSSTRPRVRPWAVPACSRSPSACSSSITTSTAGWTSSPPTAISRRRSAASSRGSSTRQPPLLFRNRGGSASRRHGGGRDARSAVRSWRAARPTPTTTTTATSTS